MHRMIWCAVVVCSSVAGCGQAGNQSKSGAPAAPVVPLVFDFSELQQSLRREGGAVVATRLQSSTNTDDHRLAAMVNAASLGTGSSDNWDQLWYQMQARTLAKGWEDVQAGLMIQQPSDSLAAYSATLDQANPAVVRSWKISDRPVTLLQLSADRSSIFMGADGGGVLVLNADTLETERHLVDIPNPLMVLDHPMGELILGFDYGAGKQSLIVYNAESGDLVSALGDAEPVRAFAGDVFMAPPIAVVGDDIIWEDNRQAIVRKNLATDEVTKYAPYPSQRTQRCTLFEYDEASNRLLTFDNLGVLWSYDLNDGSVAPTSISKKAGAYAWAGDSARHLAWSVSVLKDPATKKQRSQICCYDLQAERLLAKRTVDEVLISATYEAQTGTLLTGSRDGKIVQFSGDELTKSGHDQPAAVTPGSVTLASSFTLSRVLALPVNGRVIVGTRRGTVKLVDTQISVPPSVPVARMSDEVKARSFEDAWVADFGGNQLKICDSKSGKVLHQLEVPEEQFKQLGEIVSLGFHRSEKRIVLGGLRGILQWEISSDRFLYLPLTLDQSLLGKVVASKRVGSAPPVFVSPDGRHAVVHSKMALAIYDANSGQQKAILKPDIRHFGSKQSFLPKGRFAVTYQEFVDGRRMDGVRVYDLENGAEIFKRQHGTSMPGVGFCRRTGKIATFGRKWPDSNQPAAPGDVLAIWLPDSAAPQTVELPSEVNQFFGLAEDGDRILVGVFIPRTATKLIAIDAASHGVLKTLGLGISNMVDSEFDGRTLTIHTQDKQRHQFRYHVQ